MSRYQSRSRRYNTPVTNLPTTLPEWKDGTPTKDLAAMLDSRPYSVISFRTELSESEYEYTEWRLKPKDQKLVDDIRSTLHLHSSTTKAEQAERIYDLLRNRELVP